MKTLVLLITLLMVFTFGYMAGTRSSRPHARRPVTSAPVSQASSGDQE